MELNDGQTCQMDGLGFKDAIELLTEVNGILNWSISECFNDVTTDYTVNKLEFDYIEEINTLIGTDSDKPILDNRANLSSISLSEVKDIILHNEKEFSIIFNDGYILIKGVDNSTLLV